MKQKKLRYASLLIGVLTALSILLSQIQYYTTSAEVQHYRQKEQAQGEDQQEHDQDHQDQIVYFSVSSSTSPGSTHVELNHEAFFLFEISYKEKTDDAIDEGIQRPINRLLRILLGAIISPNAP
jgi:hypothetical protein